MFKSTGPFESGEMETVVGPEAYFHGAMTVRGSVRVEGKVDGDVLESQTVVIGATGRVNGNISAEVVVVAGEVSGDIVAAATLQLKSGAKVAGNIRTPKLLIEEGAVFDGACAMTTADSSRAKSSSDTQAEHAEV